VPEVRSPLLQEFYAATVPVPTLRRDERALQGLPGMAPDEWVMVTLRDLRPGVIELTEFFVPTDYRGRGFGSAGLKWVLELTRKHGYRIESYAQPFGTPTLSKRQLAAWYRRHGFTVRRDYSMFFA
jgi:GNAT superfamily N-acetyltransferase